MSKAEPIEKPEELPGETIADQMGEELGEVKEVYEQKDCAAWVAVEMSTGLTKSRVVFVPLARLKREDSQVRVPYRGEHIRNAPEVEPADRLEPEDDKKLRDHYGIGRGDEEIRSDSDSYAAQGPDTDGPEPIERQSGK